MLAAALALSLVACGSKKDYSTDLTGKLGITSFEMTTEDILWLEFIHAFYSAEGEAEQTLEEFREQIEAQMIEAGETFSLDDIELLLEMYDMEYKIDDKDDDRTIITFDSGHIYGISKDDGKLDFVKWTLTGEKTNFTLGVWEAVIDEGINNWTDDYGKPEVDKNERFYTWYGNVNGENASLSIEKGNGITIASMMELDRVK